MATAPSASVREPAAAASRNGDVMLWRSAVVASILICAAYAAVAPALGDRAGEVTIALLAYESGLVQPGG